jgi:hypothetical protein
LGDVYLHGVDVAQDHAEALRLYQNNNVTGGIERDARRAGPWNWPVPAPLLPMVRTCAPSL